MNSAPSKRANVSICAFSASRIFTDKAVRAPPGERSANFALRYSSGQAQGNLFRITLAEIGFAKVVVFHALVRDVIGGREYFTSSFGASER